MLPWQTLPLDGVVETVVVPAVVDALLSVVAVDVWGMGVVIGTVQYSS